jgi:hypothetical protein
MSPDRLCYVGRGPQSGALSQVSAESLYAETVNGIALIDWVARVVEGEPVDDVHCTDCISPGLEE